MSGSEAKNQTPETEKPETRLKRLNQLLRLFAHEFRNPLTVIKGDMEVALLKTRDPVEYQAVMRSNLEEIDRIERLIDDLSTLFQAEAGELKLDRSRLNLKEIIGSLAAKFRETASQKGLDLTISCKNDILSVVADQRRVQQLFARLLENALVFSEERGRVEVILEGREAEAWVTIRDQGRGIPPEELPHVFDPSFKSGKRNYSALSLNLCRAIARAHNGSLQVNSRTGRDAGIEIVVRLPLENTIP